MQIRNALIFLQKIKNIFPVIKSHADSILKYLECVKNMEMSDLKQTTESYENIFRKKIESMPDVDMKKLRESVKQKSQNKIIIKKPEPKEEIKAEAPRKDEGNFEIINCFIIINMKKLLKIEATKKEKLVKVMKDPLKKIMVKMKIYFLF